MAPSHPSELRWWVDHAGSTHTHCEPENPEQDTMAVGMIYPESKSGVIISIYGRPASMALVTQQLLDILHRRFPGTRWWIKDPAPTPQEHQHTS